MSARIDYMGVFGVIAVVMGVVVAIGGKYMHDRLKEDEHNPEKRYDHSGYNDKIIFGIMIMLTIVAIVVTFVLIPGKPEEPPVGKPKPATSDPFSIDDVLTDDSETFKIEVPAISENLSGCGSDCRTLSYQVDLTTAKGKLILVDSSLATTD